jgi:hypothetical protein
MFTAARFNHRHAAAERIVEFERAALFVWLAPRQCSPRGAALRLLRRSQLAYQALI